MAVPVLESWSTFEDVANTTSRTIPKPTGAASGEWLIGYIGMDGTGAVTSSDFTDCYNRLDSKSSHRGKVIARKVTGAEGSTFTITSSSEQGHGWLGRFSGIDASITDPLAVIDVLSAMTATGINNKVGVPAIYAGSADTYILSIYSQDGGIANTTGNGIPSGRTEIYQDAGGTAGVGLSVTQTTNAAAGYVGKALWTCTAATDEFIAVQFAIRSTASNSALPSQAVLKCSEVETGIASSSTDIVLPLPYGTVQNDGLILAGCIESGSLTVSADFTSVRTGNTGGAITLSTWRFVADGSMPSTYSVAGGNFAKSASIHRWQNIDTAAFVDGSAITTGTTDNTPVAPSVTPSVNNCGVMYFGAADDDDLTPDNTYYASTTGLYSWPNTANADVSMFASYNIQTTATATGTPSATLNAAEEWAAVTIVIKPSAATAYTLVVGTGTYTLTGQAVTLKTTRKVTVGTGTYTLTGNAVTLRRGYPLAVGVGSYTLTGQAVTLRTTRKVTAGAGSYTLTGNSVILRRGYPLTVGVGSYTLTGNDISFHKGFALPVGAGSYALTGNDVTLTATRRLAVGTGTYTLTGNAVGLRATRTMPIGAGSYTLTGNDVTLRTGRKLTAGTGAYTITGISVTFQVARYLPAGTGAYTLTGQDVTLSYGSNIVLPVGTGVYTLTGNDVGLTTAKKLGVGTGSYVLTGNDVELTYTPIVLPTGPTTELHSHGGSEKPKRSMRGKKANFGAGSVQAPNIPQGGGDGGGYQDEFEDLFPKTPNTEKTKQKLDTSPLPVAKPKITYTPPRLSPEDIALASVAGTVIEPMPEETEEEIMMRMDDDFILAAMMAM